MNFLGVGPGEIVLILIVLLVVVGPERLPALSRQAGRLVVQGRDWLQNKPEMELMMRARQEIEGELEVLKSGLREVQLVRDEVLGTAKQLTDSVNPMIAARPDFVKLINAQTVARQDEAALDEPIPASTPAEAVAAPDEAAIWEAQDHQATAAEPEPMNALISTQLDTLGMQMQAIMMDLRALQQQLQQQGALASDWTPPSHGMNLPEHSPTPPASQPEEVA
jgi:sec-independent protein translocase protein TatB